MGSYTKSAFKTLRSIPELFSVPDSQVEWLLKNSEIRFLQVGEFLFKPEMPVDQIFIILEGNIDLFFIQGGNKNTFLQYQKGGILGYLPYSRVQKSIGYGVTTSPTEILSYPKSRIREMIIHNPELTEELVHVMVSRACSITAQTLHTDKMLTLGKLSAGLTHELNNPIASIHRDNAELNRLILSENLSELAVNLSGLDAEEQPELLKAIRGWRNSCRPSNMKPSDIRKAENDWMEKLENWGMKNPEEAAEVFTDFGINPEEILLWIKKMKPQVVEAWLSWIQFLLQTQSLVFNIKNATERISKLIGAVKAYTHLDQTPVKTELNLAKGIEDTLSIFAHKIKATHVEISFTKPESPITVFGFPGELNQIWTNLIDNALDALEGTNDPMLEITISPEIRSIVVQITDNGPGIPDEIKPRIFDSFFTTKGIGKGTGIGLDLVNQIVKKHRGSISVDSSPGKTTFKIELPKN